MMDSDSVLILVFLTVVLLYCFSPPDRVLHCARRYECANGIV